MAITIPTSVDFWRWLCRFAYARWAPAQEVRPHGIPGHRDPEAPCTGYAPRPARFHDFTDCDSDGHYLCGECAHYRSPAELDRSYADAELRTDPAR
jgi:hypothetical protein